jgi:hypothetical protein
VFAKCFSESSKDYKKYIMEGNPIWSEFFENFHVRIQFFLTTIPITFRVISAEPGLICGLSNYMLEDVNLTLGR